MFPENGAVFAAPKSESVLRQSEEKQTKTPPKNN